MEMKEPIRMVDGTIYDFIGGVDNVYVQNYERISKDFNGRISVETSVFGNLCQMLTQESGFDKVLDIGCGRGYVLDFVKAREKVGLDVSLNELQNIPPESGIKRIRAFAENLPFTGGYFDCVLCMDVIEHVLFLEQVVFDICRVLKKEGSLFVACPWEQDLSVYESEEYKKRFKQYDFKHLRSIDSTLIDGLFGENFKLINETAITAHERFMVFKSYSIKFMHFIKLGDR